MDRLPAVMHSSGPSGPAGGMRIMLRSTPSSSAAIWASAVTMPWPSSTLPTRTAMVPSGRTSIHRDRSGFAARSFGSSAIPLTGPDHGPDHPLLRPAPAQVLVQCGSHGAGVRSRLAVEQRGRGHDDPGDAIAALRRLFLEERLLHRV